MAKLLVALRASVRLAGAVVTSAPGAGTVTLIVMVAPLESLITSGAVPDARPPIVKLAPVMAPLAMVGLPLLTE